MKKLLIILSLFLTGLTLQAQSLITYGLTPVQVADSVNANLLELFYYADSSLVTVFDTLTDTHQSVQLAALQEPLDSLAEVFGITLSDGVFIGMKAARFRLALNTTFQELYTYMEANPSVSGYWLATQFGDAILTENEEYIIIE